MAAGIVAWTPVSAAENFGEQMVNTFKNGEFDVNFRYRYEFVDQDNTKKNANASTLRTRLVFRTAKWNNLDLTVNMDDIHAIVGYNYNSTRNGKTQYQTVADPTGTELNIAALTYSGLQNTKFVLGRQRIIRANHRFIGNVGWRQNEQTYDALSGYYEKDSFKVFYSYVDKVNRIFGPESGKPSASFASDSHLLDASYKLNNALSVAVYGYWLDLDSKTGTPAAFNASNQTYGIRFTGAPKINDDWTLTYVAELATQKDYQKNVNNYDADYVFLQLGFKWNRFSLKGGYELLGSDNSAGVAFQTPLATLHAHNGWADKFLSTPAAGLEDVSLAASAKVLKGSMALVLHDFSSDSGSTDYGTEVDVVAKWPFAKHYSVLGKLAFYNADDGPANLPTASLGQDTTKAWLMMTAAF